MYLVEAESGAAVSNEQKLESRRPVSARWEDFPYSRLSHHGGACCDVAREWVLAMDFAQLNGADLSSGPRWLRARYKWGPSAWPMHWCELVGRKVIDCGAHAALSREAFAARGLTAFPVQLVQRYSEGAVEEWRGSWNKEGVSCHWLDGEHIYHEATALLVGDGEVKIWDGSAGSWANPRQSGRGYGSVLALRLFADPESVTPAGFRWGDRQIAANVWNELV
ncbi:MAG TPA: hypothetical protein VM346_00085 [Sphingomicrobium sp.]|nr:hypothetical protein [Sphingomicrobium sp.]